MKVICVGGSSSHCGKTAVVSLLLKAFPGWAAVKVTPCRSDEICPRGDECGACKPPDGPYEIVECPESPGKDTARYLEAGASRVLWVRSLPEFLPEALESALARLSDAPGVIIESTTAIHLLDGLNILVIREGVDEIKESAQRCMDKVDLIMLNIRDTQALSSNFHVEAPMLKAWRVIPMCAILPLEHHFNQEFLTAVNEFDL